MIQPFNGILVGTSSKRQSIRTNSCLAWTNYLRSLLEQTAREAISGLSLMSANYDEAISILTRPFGSKQQIVNKHMDVLLNVEPVTSQQNVRG